MSHPELIITKLADLETEARNPRTSDLDTLSTEVLVKALHDENLTVLKAVEEALVHLADLVDRTAERLILGGRLFYVGAGTSGRLGVLDASECPPTFGVDPELIQGIIAGGDKALKKSVEGAEDVAELGAADLRAVGVTINDVVVGISASGRTPYVTGALQEAKTVGALTAAIVNVSNSEHSHHASITLAAITGPESISGSTRMKAGTAQKLILNILSTAVMVRLGKVYGNLMVDVRANNDKLRDRAVRIVKAATGADQDAAERALAATNGRAKSAIVMLVLDISPTEAEDRLARAGGWVRHALEMNETD